MIRTVEVLECDRCQKHIEFERSLTPGGYMYLIPYDWHEENMPDKKVHLCPRCYLLYDFLTTFLRSKKKKKE